LLGSDHFSCCADLCSSGEPGGAPCPPSEYSDEYEDYQYCPALETGIACTATGVYATHLSHLISCCTFECLPCSRGTVFHTLAPHLGCHCINGIVSSLFLYCVSSYLMSFHALSCIAMRCCSSMQGLRSDKLQHARPFVVTKCIKNKLLSTDDNPWTCCFGVQIHVSSERPV